MINILVFKDASVNRDIYSLYGKCVSRSYMAYEQCRNFFTTQSPDCVVKKVNNDCPETYPSCACGLQGLSLDFRTANYDQNLQDCTEF
jgi:hypothetical protein